MCLTFGERPKVEVEELPEVPCDEPHQFEVYGVLNYTAAIESQSSTTSPDVYPGFEALQSFSRAECLGAFQDFVGISPLDSSELYYSWIVPSVNSWESDEQDREILCVAARRDSSDLPAGSIKDTAR